jgi:hypothetical protein
MHRYKYWKRIEEGAKPNTEDANGRFEFLTRAGTS